MIRETALAVVFVLVGASYGSGDYELRTPTESIKAKSRDSCEAAQRAIVRGWIVSIPRDTPTWCIPHPGYFTPEENCIKNFNCERKGD